MKRSLALAAIIVAAITYGGAVVVGLSRDATTPSPFHTVNVYLDGLNHLDYRQACSVIHAPIPFPNISQCEAYFAFNTAMTGTQEYRIVHGSQKVWTQDYCAKHDAMYAKSHPWYCSKHVKVRLAVVQYANLTTPYILTAHLRIIHGAWKIVAVTT